MQVKSKMSGMIDIVIKHMLYAVQKLAPICRGFCFELSRFPCSHREMTAVGYLERRRDY